MTRKESTTMTNYLEFVDKLVAEDKTTGENQSDSLKYYTQLSLRRMKRWSKTGELIPEMIEKLSQIKEKQKWVVITEAWCGDAAHAYMFIQKMADSNPNITLEWVLRDENLELMDQYLTNNGRAIPKLIAFDQQGNELFNWGPRPKHIQEKYWEMRNAKTDYKEIMLEVQRLYNEDKGVSMQKEILDLMDELKLAKSA